MPSKFSDAWLWFGLGVFMVLAVKGVAYGLRDVEQLTQINKPQKPKPKPRQVQRAAEDTINIESLRTLATCGNVEISKAAARIIVDRFINNPAARNILQRDLDSPNIDVAERAQKTVLFLNNMVGTEEWRYSSHHMRRTSQNFSSVPLHGVRSRQHEESSEEQALRRRRREAMVLNEGDRPVSQDDIIQMGGRMTEAEARVVEQALEDRARAERE